jgi:hypothetical protein
MSRLSGAAFLLSLAAIPAPDSDSSQRAAGDPNSREYWNLVQTLSEPAGYYPSENLVSSERHFPPVIRALGDRGTVGGAYIGVGPEQNFHYIAALRPSIAFIVDIRRENRSLHLLYKALFELAGDRAEFLALLFSRSRPPGLSRNSTAHALVSAFKAAQPVSRRDFDLNLSRVIKLLSDQHGFPLNEDDRADLARAYGAFYWHGLEISYTARPGAPSSGTPTYAELIEQADPAGLPRSFVATEGAFAVVKDLQTRNLVVPIVGDFAGPSAIRAVGEYLRSRRLEVSVFYVSDVEPTLLRNGGWTRFCSSVSSLPLSESSVFIRSAPTGPVPALDGTPRWPVRTPVGDTGFSIDLMRPEINACAPR